MNRSVENNMTGFGAVVGAAVALVLHHVQRLYLGTSAGALLGAAINVGAIAAGFLATCQSILLTGTESRVVKKMRGNEHFGRLLRFISNSIKCSFLLAVCSALLMICDFQKKDVLHSILAGGWLVTAFMTAFSYYRSIQILLSVLEAAPESSDERREHDPVDSDLLPSE